MLTDSSMAISVQAFAARCREIASEPDREKRHRLFDQASNDLLCSLGYSEGVAIFLAHVGDYHAPSSPSVSA